MYILIMLILSIIYLGFAIYYYIAMSRIWAEPKKEKKKHGIIKSLTKQWMILRQEGVFLF